MSQKQELDRLKRQVEKHEALQGRQIDTINRLLGHVQDNPTLPRYEHELMHLNEQVALADLRRESYEGVLRKIRQSCKDRLNTSILTDVMAQKFLALIEEVMPSERPPDLDEGRTDDAGEAEAEARHAA